MNYVDEICGTKITCSKENKKLISNLFNYLKISEKNKLSKSEINLLFSILVNGYNIFEIELVLKWLNFTKIQLSNISQILNLFELNLLFSKHLFSFLAHFETNLRYSFLSWLDIFSAGINLLEMKNYKPDSKIQKAIKHIIEKFNRKKDVLKHDNLNHVFVATLSYRELILIIENFLIDTTKQKELFKMLLSNPNLENFKDVEFGKCRENFFKLQKQLNKLRNKIFHHEVLFTIDTQNLLKNCFSQVKTFNNQKYFEIALQSKKNLIDEINKNSINISNLNLFDEIIKLLT